MAFKLPRLSDAGFAKQAEPDSPDFDIIVAGHARTGVRSGCDVSAQPTPNMTVAVASGVYEIDGVHVVFAGATVTLTADPTNAKRALITGTSAGAAALVDGTPAANPFLPAIPAGRVVLATVEVPAAAATIGATNITDKRVLLHGVLTTRGDLLRRGAAGDERVAVGTSGTVLTSDGADPVWLRTLSRVNVENHGVRTTNTATQNAGALNTLFTDIKAGTITARIVDVPNIYDINASILVDIPKIEIVGANQETSGFNQTTANTPVLRWDNESDNTFPGQMWYIYLHRLGLTHSAQATAATPQQFGIRFRPSPTGASPGAWNGNGFFLNCFEDLVFRQCYKGLGVDPNAGVVCVLWSSEFRNLTFWDTKQTALYLSDAGLGGAPSNLFDTINVLNYQMRRSNGLGNYATGPAIDLNGHHGGVVNVLNIEDWVDLAVLLQSCNGMVVNGLRFERHDFRTNLSAAVYIGACAGLTINGYYNQLLRANQTSQAYLLRVEASSNLTLNGFAADRASGSGTDITVGFWGDPTNSTVNLNGSGLNRVPGGGAAASLNETLTSGWGTGLYVVRSRDGVPPIVDALPAASATYRGRRFQVEGGTGVADASYECRKGSDNLYTWVAAGPGDVVGPAASVDSEVALFSGTTGKLLKRSALTGVVKHTAGVAEVATFADIPRSGAVYAAVADSAAISATTATLLSNGSFSVPANTFVAGRSYKVKAVGRYTTGATAGSVTAALLIGGASVVTTGAVAYTVSIAAATNAAVVIEAIFTVRTAGATGAVVGYISRQMRTTASAVIFVDIQSAATVALNTTIARVIDLQWTWSATGNTVTFQQFIIEAV